MTTNLEDNDLELLCDLVSMEIQDAIEATDRAIAKTQQTIELLEISEKVYKQGLN